MSAWIRKPTTTKRGERRYSVGYTDEMGRERTKGGFRTRAEADVWRRRYFAATASGDLAGLLGVAPVPVGAGAGAPQGTSSIPDDEEMTLAEFMALFFAAEAPALAETTTKSYLSIYNKHIRPNCGSQALSEFARPKAVLDLLGSLQARGVSRDVQVRTRKVLSSALSWGVQLEMLPDNGVKKIETRSNRRSVRSGRAKVVHAPSEVLSVRDAAALLDEIRRSQLDPLLSARDQTIVLAQFMLGCRNQDVWPLTAGSLGERSEVAFIGEKVKVDGSLRTMPLPTLLRDQVAAYLELRRELGEEVVPGTPLFPGPRAGSSSPMSDSQGKAWSRRHFRGACIRLAERDRRFAHMRESTQYALRRGHISTRMQAGEDIRRVAQECATSPDMIFKHYWRELAITDGDKRPLPEQLAEAIAQHREARRT